jgi:hypothetical protein
MMEIGPNDNANSDNVNNDDVQDALAYGRLRRRIRRSRTVEDNKLKPPMRLTHPD